MKNNQTGKSPIVVSLAVKKVPDLKREPTAFGFKKALYVFTIAALVVVGLNFPSSPTKATVAVGIVRVCKIIIGADGQITDGANLPSTNFTVHWLNGSNLDPETVAPVPSDTVFSNPLELNANLVNDNGAANDAMCVNVNSSVVGHYYYDQEGISPSYRSDISASESLFTARK